MVFSSMTFVPLFLPAVFLLYFCGKNVTWRNGVLLVFSLLFYAWGEPVCVFLMVLSVFINYLAGLVIDAAPSRGIKTAALLIALLVSLGMLFYYKYSGFFTDVFTGLLGMENPFPKPTLPIGISFYTFQVITYTVDVYRGKVPVQLNFPRLLMYVSFFPQLIAGPIVNYTDIADSLGKRKITRSAMYNGFLRFFIGMAKKVLLANTCGIISDKILSAGELSFAGSWLMAVSYALQIYFDFSGYSDMAIGMGRIFGFKFRENFNYPYISRSITEFWRRWHMSLGAFFRDYVYIPLGGNRVSTGKHIRNILIVWMLTGFWHGASWNFILWGLYYGLLLLAEKFLLKGIKDRLPAVLNIAVTLMLVLIGWVLFYYEDLSQGLQHLAIMFGITKRSLIDPYTVYYCKHYLVVLVISILACLPWNTAIDSLPKGIRKPVKKVRKLLKPLVLTLLFLLSVAMVITQSYNPFLYFRF